MCILATAAVESRLAVMNCQEHVTIGSTPPSLEACAYGRLASCQVSSSCKTISSSGINNVLAFSLLEPSDNEPTS